MVPAAFSICADSPGVFFGKPKKCRWRSLVGAVYRFHANTGAHDSGNYGGASAPGEYTGGRDSGVDHQPANGGSDFLSRLPAGLCRHEYSRAVVPGRVLLELDDYGTRRCLETAVVRLNDPGHVDRISRIHTHQRVLAHVDGVSLPNETFVPWRFR